MHCSIFIAGCGTALQWVTILPYFYINCAVEAMQQSYSGNCASTLHLVLMKVKVRGARLYVLPELLP